MKAFYIERIPVHSALTLDVQPKKLSLQGPLGTVHVDTRLYDPQSVMAVKHVHDAQNISHLHVYAPSKQKLQTFCSLFKSYMEGVSQGFLLHIEAVGVGYKIQVTQQEVVFRVGLSHAVSCLIPNDIQMFTPKSTHLIVFGIDKQRVTQVGAQLRAIKLPEPYKGKGLRFQMEHVFRKEGKKK